MQFSKIMVVDLECTCFRDEDADRPKGWLAAKDQEIIEIGAVILDLRSLETEVVKSFLVRPDGPVGEFCTELTTLTPDDLKDKPPLAGILLDLRNWAKSNKFDIRSMPWGSWGDYDRVQFYRECARKGLGYPFGRAHFSIKGMYSMLTGQGKGFGMDMALNQLDMDLEGTHHRGVDDARNTAKILQHLLGKARS